MVLEKGVLSSVERLEALHRLSILDTPPEEQFDRITRLATRLIGAEVALMSLVTDNRQFFKSSCGLPGSLSHVRETPLSHSFCQHVVASNQPLIVEDARSDTRVSDNLAIAELGVVSYLGVPIRDREGFVLGSLCAIGTVPRNWTSEDVNLMGDLAAILEDQLLLQQSVRQANTLAEENAVLAREYHHRVKNALSVAASLVRLTRREAETGEDVLTTVEGRLNALASAHNSLISESDNVDLAGLIERLLLPYAASGVSVRVLGSGVSLRQRQVTPMCLIIHELATNSAKYGAFATSGAVSVTWTGSDKRNVELLWSETSTASKNENADGFGGKLLAIAASQMGGRLDQQWVGSELLITLTFPLQANPPDTPN